MTEEFFQGRVEEEVGGDIDRSTPTKRLQTERPDRATQGRIVITLHYDIDRKLWEPGETDAVDMLRRWVTHFKEWEDDEETALGSRGWYDEHLKGLIEACRRFEIEAAK